MGCPLAFAATASDPRLLTPSTRRQPAAMDHPLNQASIDGLDEMDKILKGMAELDGDTTPHADASLEALRRGEKSLKDEWPAGMDENVEKLIKAARNAREHQRESAAVAAQSRSVRADYHHPTPRPALVGLPR